MHLGHRFPNFEMLNAKTASSLKKIITTLLQEERPSEEQTAQMEDRFPSGRQIAYMICEYFRVAGAHEAVLDYSDLFSIALHCDDIENFDTR